MTWMHDPRGKPYDEYGDVSEGGLPSVPMGWYEIPLFFIFFILLPYIFGLFMLLCGLYAFYMGFKAIAKYSMQQGKLEIPGLVYAGIALAIGLGYLISSHRFFVSDHPFITLCSSTFILLATLAPLTGFGLRFIGRFFNFNEKE